MGFKCTFLANFFALYFCKGATPLKSDRKYDVIRRIIIRLKINNFLDIDITIHANKNMFASDVCFC